MSTYIIVKKCPFGQCSNVTEAEVDEVGYDRWRSGLFIQDAFPQLSVTEREFIKTGFCPEHMELVFGEESN